VPYTLIPLIASVMLGFYHVVITDAPAASKVIVSIVVLAAVVMFLRVPELFLVALVLQSAVSIYVLVGIRLSERES
jgi:hypothetical protein